MISRYIGLMMIVSNLGSGVIYAAEAAAPVSVRDDGKALTLSIGEKKVLRYHYAVMPPPEGAHENFRRSGFIHPLWAPDGQVLTTIHPRDHIHHMGLWHPWTKTTFEGRDVDFWNLKAGRGTCRFVEVISIESGMGDGGFRVAQEAVDLSAPSGEKVVLDETLDVRVRPAADASGAFIIDYTITQRCASESSLLLEAYRYGGSSFRATEEWHGTNSFMEISEDKDRESGHGAVARWCNVHGSTEAGPAGIVFMSHPGNHAHPEPMRIWDSKANGGRSNVFFNFCPVQKEAWMLEPGQDYVRRYRLYVYAGAVDAKKAESLWQAFSRK